MRAPSSGTPRVFWGMSNVVVAGPHPRRLSAASVTVEVAEAADGRERLNAIMGEKMPWCTPQLSVVTPGMLVVSLVGVIVFTSAAGARGAGVAKGSNTLGMAGEGGAGGGRCALWCPVVLGGIGYGSAAWRRVGGSLGGCWSWYCVPMWRCPPLGVVCGGRAGMGEYSNVSLVDGGVALGASP